MISRGSTLPALGLVLAVFAPALTCKRCARGAASSETAPIAAPGSAKIVSIAAAGDRTCAVFDDGRVACWGDGSTQPRWLTGVPPATAIALGGAHRCLLTRSGEVMCEGANDSGQLGRARSTARAASPERVAVSNTRAVYAGDRASCAIDARGLLECWGGPRGWHQKQPAILAVARDKPVKKVSVSDYDHAALLESGEILWWGMPTYFESHSGRYHAPPEAPATVSVETPARDVCAAPWHSCAVDARGRVHCWGASGVSNYRLGYIPDSGVERMEHSPLLRGQVSSIPGSNDTLPVVENVADAVEVSCAAYHSCARLASGRVSCWGSTEHRGTKRRDPGWGQYLAQDVDGVTDAIQLASGASHTCALRADRTIACWGAGQSGQLGDGTEEFRSLPVTVRFATGDP